MLQISKKRRIYLLLFLSIFIFLSSLHERVITFDDAYFAEQAYWVNKVGYSRSELFSDVLDWGERQFVYHKLHVWQIAVIAKYIGWSPYFFKAVSLFYLGILLIFVYLYNRRYLSPDRVEPFYLFISLLLANTYIVNFSFLARPEIMMICVGFLSFFLIRLGIEKNNSKYLVISGILAGAAALFHLNGLIYIAAGTVLIIYMRHYRYLPVFIISATLISMLYWFEMLTNNAIDIGFLQLINDPAVEANQHSAKTILLKLLSSPKRFVSHLFDFSYSLLLVLSLYFYRDVLRKNYEVKLLLVYFIAAELCLSVISPGGKAHYLVLHMPFVLLVISSLHNTVISKTIMRTMLVAFSFYFVTQIGHIIGLMSRSNPEIINQHALIFEKYNIRKADKVLVPAIFVFNQIENAKIGATELIPLHARAGKIKFNRESIFNYAKENKYKYLIFDTDYLSEFSNNNHVLNHSDYGYKALGREFSYSIFQLKE